MMPTLWVLCSVEFIKLRRTPALWMTFVAPLLVVLLELVLLFDRRSFPNGDATRVWHDLLANGWALWLMFFAPMLIAFQAASLANVEHAGRHWKQLFAFPIPRWGVYAAKVLVSGLLLGVSFMLVTTGFVLDVLIYSAVGGHRLALEIPWFDIMSTACRAYFACWLMIGIQSWLSARFAGMATPIGIGFAALVIGIVLTPIRRGALSSWHPWTLPLYTLVTEAGADRAMVRAVAGGVGGLVLAVAACWDLARRREHA